MTRRRWLRTLSAAIACSAGCGPVPAERTATSPPLAMAAPPSAVWAQTIGKAWDARRSGFGITFGAGSTRCPAVDLIFVQQSSSLTSPIGDRLDAQGLAEVLKGANIDEATFLPGIADSYRDAQGRLSALPVGVGELQFFVNAEALARHGLADQAQWTFSACRQAVSAVAPAAGGNGAPLIVGEGWGAFNTWAALVDGLGGMPLSGDGTLNPLSTLDATSEVVDLARAAHWNPTPTYEADSPEGAFLQQGFAGAAAAALFAFARPWNLSPVLLLNHAQARSTNVLTACRTTGMCRLVARPFPSLPRQPWTPAADGWAITLAPRSTRTAEVAAFLGWLYAPAQQQLLAGVGIPPVIGDTATQAVWQASTASGHLPRFDPQRYHDAASKLAPGAIRDWALRPAPTPQPNTPPDFEAGCLAMYEGTDPRSVLEQWQALLPSLAPAPAITSADMSRVEMAEASACPRGSA